MYSTSSFIGLSFAKVQPRSPDGPASRERDRSDADAMGEPARSRSGYEAGSGAGLAGESVARTIPFHFRMRSTASVGCAPWDSHSRTFSTFTRVVGGLVRGL